MKSIELGNKVIGIHINSIPDKYNITKVLGNNPFEYVALRFNNDGTLVTPLEYKNGQWMDLNLLGSFGIQARPQEEWGNSYKLSRWLLVYDWIANDGFNNFANWIK